MFADAKNTEDIQTLVDLGLTYRQSKILLALSFLGEATINSVSSTAKMDRANVYRTMKQLRDLKLVQMSIKNPVTFEALPLNDAVLLLMEGNKNKYNDAEIKAKRFLRKHRQICGIKANPIESQFLLVPGGKLTINKIGELAGSTKITHDGILYFKDIYSRNDFFYNLFTELLLNRIKIRIIISFENGEILPSNFTSLMKNRHFKIRKAKSKPEVTFSIWDKEKGFLTITPKISEPMTDGLFVDNRAIVGLIQEYFELIWKGSEPIP